MTGIFPESAPLFANAVLVLELLIGSMLIVGMFLVRAGHVRLHSWVQGSMVLANLAIVLSWMVPSYLANVLPDLPRELAGWAYLLPTLMLVVGAIAEGLGVYVILVAATNWVPERFRFRRYKRWMRTLLGLWWTVLILGISTYYVFYIAAPGTS